MTDFIIQILLFLLSFLLTYGFLRKLKMFYQTTNLIVSLIIAFYFLFASIYYSEDMVQILGYSTLALIIVFAIVLIYFSMKK